MSDTSTWGWSLAAVVTLVNAAFVLRGWINVRQEKKENALQAQRILEQIKMVRFSHEAALELLDSETGEASMTEEMKRAQQHYHLRSIKEMNETERRIVSSFETGELPGYFQADLDHLKIEP